MAWLICGSVPDPDFPLSQAVWTYKAEKALLEQAESGLAVAAARGTPALLACALQTCKALGAEPPQALLCGDIGDGHGSADLYRHLASSLSKKKASPWQGITFHYLFPDLDGHGRVFAAVEGLDHRPLLVADAGFMYAAKMSGLAPSYDLFTPDNGELAFLADEKAPHPLYTRGFLGAGDMDVQELAARAWANGGAAGMLLVKGATDMLVREGRVTASVSEPNVPALEAIGGTGDVVAGLVTGLLSAGHNLEKACLAAACAGRRAGELARPTPATQVAEILPYIPEAVQWALRRMSG